MTRENQIDVAILRVLRRMNGAPISQDTLRISVRIASNLTITDADLDARIKECETEGWITGTADRFTGIVWVLTPLGKIQAQRLQ